MKTKKREIGDLGEGIACNYLKNKGFKIVEQNYWKPWGEIDIIAEKQGITYFVEVKSVTRGTLNDVSVPPLEKGRQRRPSSLMGHVTKQYNPVDNLHPWKLKRLARTIQSYIFRYKLEKEWKFLAVIVYLNIKDKTAKVELLENIVL
ncbi:MAG: YraN family protein [Candidatus Pacebacteria bacterium]|nr:YraN family protein [Candidatus Paceibacterota bacterium]